MSSASLHENPPKAAWLEVSSPSAWLRRSTPILVIAICFAVLSVAQDWWVRRLGNEMFVTGYTLLAVLLALMGLGVRKRIVGTSLGRVAIWQRTHHYLGAFCLIVYVTHAGILTTGWLESSLAFLFWFILLTGIASWYVNKTSPKMLRAAGPAILRSDIPQAKQAVAEQAYRYAMEAAGNANSAALADYYRTDLADYFSGGRSVWYRIMPTGFRRRAHLAALDRVSRYLDDKGLQLKDDMSQMVKARDDLDFQLAIQHRVRFFAVLHTCLLGAFVVISICHVVLAHQYSSSW